MDFRTIVIDQQSHSTVRSRTKRSARFYHKFFSRKTLIALVVVNVEYFKVLNLSNQRILTIHRTRERIAVHFVRDEASITNLRFTIALKAVQADAMTRFAWKNQYGIADIAARKAADILQIWLDQIERHSC